MALKTITFNASVTLQGAQFYHNPTSLLPADLATIAANIFKDGSDNGGNKPGVILPGAFTRSGMLWKPATPQNPIKVRQGDWVAVDMLGNVYYLPVRALPKTLTLTCAYNNGQPTITATSSLYAAMWQNGTYVTGSGIPANSLVCNISPNGLSFNICNTSGTVVNPTQTQAEATLTGGVCSHT